MRVIIKENYEEMSKEAALFLKERISSTVLGLSTGSTSLGMYKELIKMNLDFSFVKTFNLDEYVGLKYSDKNSFHYQMWHNFFNHINIKEQNVSILNGMSLDLNQECLLYENKIKENGGIDIQVLGIGTNGHLGFNEPGSAFDSVTRDIELTFQTRKDNSRFFNSIEDVPKGALTMGIATILGAKEHLLLASGKHKAEIIKKVLKGDITEQVPASILQNSSQVTVILDKEAASLL